MNPFSFRKIKLFKRPAILSKKAFAAPAQNSHKPEKRPLAARIFENPYIFLFGFVFILAYFISYLPSKSLPLVKPGDIATSDIISPVDLTFEDKETTENRRRDAEAAVLPVYTFDPNVSLGAEERIRQFFALGRDWGKKGPVSASIVNGLQKDASEKLDLDIAYGDLEILLRNGFSADLEETLVTLTSRVLEKGIIRSKILFLYQELEHGFLLVKQGAGERVIKVDEIADLKQGKEALSAEVEMLDLSPRLRGLLIDLADFFIAPNVTFNKAEMDHRRELARSQVEIVYYSIKRGKIIIRKGDEVSEDTLKWVRLINQNLRARPSWLRNFFGTFLLFALIFIALWHYLRSMLRPKTAFDHFIMMGTMLILSLLVYKLSLFLGNTISLYAQIPFLNTEQTFWYAIPYQMGTLVFGFLTMNHITLVYSILNSLLVGYLFKASFFQMIFCLIGGLGAMYGIERFGRQKRTSTLLAGLLAVSPINIFVIVTVRLLGESTIGLAALASGALLGVLGGVLAAALAFLSLPIFESVFGFVTASKLLELANSDLPIFRQMAVEAPGSYHHSLIVSSLAEKAAEEIKLDPMLVKAGALYHDIGKIKMPEYFIENAVLNPDMHRDLTPRLSTLVIINHVKEGVEFARKLKLPQRLKEVIEQHHGNSLVRYFFQKAKQESDPDLETVGEETYRYPGPPPQSKEAALIMLADSVEAASRSLKAPTKGNLKRVIIDIFDGYLQDGQLDDCEFSTKELQIVAASFLATLFTIYHPRLRYPDSDFEGKRRKKPETTRTNGNDRDHQPPE